MGKKPKTWKNFFYDLATGGVAASVAKTINAPLERVKLINQTGAKGYNGLIDTLVKLPREEGALAYWRGNGANVIRYFPTQALNFAFKDSIKEMLMPGGPKNYSYWSQFGRGLAAGGAAGALSLVFVYPLDLARTRMSTDMGKGAERQYNGLADTCKKVYAEGGVRALYKGFNISVAGIIPYRAVYFGGFDTLKALFLSDGKSNFWKKWGLAQANTITAQFLTYPIDTVRRVLMLAGKKGKDGTVNRTYKNAFECFQVLLKERGVRGIYKGSLANTYRATGGALCMVFYDSIKEY